MSDEYQIRNAHGRLVISLFTGAPMRLSKAIAEETRADLDLEHRKSAPHRVERAPDLNTGGVMDEQKARDVLWGDINPSNGLFNAGGFIAWSRGDQEVKLDGDFTAEQLEAIAWWMRNAPQPGASHD